MTKSKYCKSVQCKKILWLDKYKLDVAVQTARDSVLELPKLSEEDQEEVRNRLFVYR